MRLPVVLALGWEGRVKHWKERERGTPRVTRCVMCGCGVCAERQIKVTDFLELSIQFKISTSQVHCISRKAWLLSQLQAYVKKNRIHNAFQLR